MRLKSRILKISAQGHLVCMLNSEEAEELHIRNADRVAVRKGRKEVIAVVDITNTHHFLKKGQIGLMQELAEELGVKRGEPLEVDIADPPLSVDYIRRKALGETLDDSQLYYIVSDIASGKLSEQEISVFMTACLSNGLKDKELIGLVSSLRSSGDVTDFTHHPLVDLRIVGDASGMLKQAVSSIVSAAGVNILGIMESAGSKPSSSSDIFRVLGATPGKTKNANTALSRYNCAYISQEDDSIPIALRHIRNCEAPLSMYPKDLHVASILSLGLALRTSHIYTCIFYGQYGDIKDQHEAKVISRLIDRISKKLKLRTDSLVMASQDMSLGCSGPFLEADALLKIFTEEEEYAEIREKLIMISAEIIDMVKGSGGRRIAREVMDSGKALDHMLKLLRYYGSKTKRNSTTKKSTFKSIIRAQKDSTVMSVDARNMHRLARMTGAPNDLFSGVELHKGLHSVVSEGEPLMTLHSSNKSRLSRAKNFIDKIPVFELSD